MQYSIGMLLWAIGAWSRPADGRGLTESLLGMAALTALFLLGWIRESQRTRPVWIVVGALWMAAVIFGAVFIAYGAVVGIRGHFI